MRFKLRDLLLITTMVCIATAAMSVLPHRHFVLPVGLTTILFLLIGQRKVALTFGSAFLLSWILVSAVRQVVP